MNLYDLNYDQLVAFVRELGEPEFRARQIWQWLYQKFAADFDTMTNLPQPLRQKLDERVTLFPLQPVARQHSSDGQTQKVLFQLPDGNFIETVLMGYEKRRTVCIST